VSGGVRMRALLASGVLAVIVGTTFAVVLLSVYDLRRATELDRHSEQVLSAANGLERLVIDLETGLRGFVITGDERFLEPWNEARAEVPRQARSLEQLVADNPDQESRANRITEVITSYVQGYGIPLLDAARRNMSSARSVEITAEGKRRVDAIRAEFDRFVAAEDRLSATRHQAAESADERAVFAAAAGVGGSVLLILLFSSYLNRIIVRPVRAMAQMAAQIARGDLTARTPELGVGEIGMLGRSFNDMANSVERSRAELAASRARIVAAADETRRRIERDLHDGTQQRLVSLGLELRSAELAVPHELNDLRTQLSRVAQGLTSLLDELREISRGIHPAILTEGGLGPALKALGRRSPVPVELDLQTGARLPEGAEVALYFVASEALANAAKHARASVVRLVLEVGADVVRLSIRDDGVGGADPSAGSGLIGLRDRVEALGGALAITSPMGEGTSMVAELPIPVGDASTAKGASTTRGQPIS
jgi:signal transduction histidine kinase